MSFQSIYDDTEIIYEEPKDFEEQWKKNPLRRPYISAVTINCSIGKSGQPLQNAKQLIKEIFDREPSERQAKRSIREFAVRQGEPIAVMLTLRKEEAYVQLKRLLETKSYRLNGSSFDEFGNFGFGIREHINIPGTRYDPNLGIVGLNVLVKLARPGYRIHYRQGQQKKIPRKHKVTRDEAISHIAKQFNVKVIARD